jgi:polyhydroxybutyrate depolymerase
MLHSGSIARHLARFLTFAILVLAPSFARSEDATTQSTPQELTSPAKPGRYTIVVRSGGFDRVAQVQIPLRYTTTGAKPPLVLILHGAGGSGAGALDKNGWAAKADKEGFIAAAPDGLPAFPLLPANFRSNPPLWNTGQLKAGTPRAAIDDVAFIKQLLGELQQKAPYDESRVFCAGHSNGGGMTFRLATELSQRLAAIGTVAGMLVAKDPQPKKPLPTLCILGDKDPLLPIGGGEIKLPWGTRQNPPVAEPLAAWAKAIGCEAEPKTVSDKDGLKKVEYPSKSGGPMLTVVTIAGHGHHWPGGKVTLPESMIGPITHKLDATDALWDFFKANGATSSR